jgi:hypothetical protein
MVAQNVGVGHLGILLEINRKLVSDDLSDCPHLAVPFKLDCKADIFVNIVYFFSSKPIVYLSHGILSDVMPSGALHLLIQVTGLMDKHANPC